MSSRRPALRAYAAQVSTAIEEMRLEFDDADLLAAALHGFHEDIGNGLADEDTRKLIKRLARMKSARALRIRKAN